MSGRIWLICTLTLALLMSVPGGAGNISQAVSDIEVFIVADGKQCLVEERPDVAGRIEGNADNRWAIARTTSYRASRRWPLR